ncbi:MAG: glycosyltransferase [Deltaproteobacteria bacterium]|nr:glycosyltransferase [Deltaproteobacteria bacterium]
MTSQKPVSLSLCMIVKNEERFLSDCLSSARHWVDEMVIVDTGSTDRTVNIAQSHGAKVYHHPWENDFSKHRNQSIRYATGDWILWLDADEALEPGAGDILRKWITEKDADSLAVTMVCYFANRSRQSWNNAIKVFKNGVGIHFEGAVHNQVVGYRRARFCPVKIYHYGYDTDQKTVWQKFKRTSSLLKEAIRKEPRNFRHHHDLAVCYASVRMYRKAIDQGLIAIERYKTNDGKDPNILWTYFVVASSYFNLGMMDQARKTAIKATCLNPDHLDSHFVLASIYARQKDRKKFEASYHRIARLLPKYFANPHLLEGLVVNKMGEKWRLDIHYGILWLVEGNKRKARQLLAKAIESAPDKQIAYRMAVIECRESGNLKLADEWLGKARKEGIRNPWITFEKALLMKASGNTGRYRILIAKLLRLKDIDDPELLAALGTEALKSGNFQDAESILSSAARNAYENPKVFTSLALACKYQGKIDDALRWNHRALEMEDTNEAALVNLGHLYFNMQAWDSAQHWYSKALHEHGPASDVLFRLSLLALMKEDFKGCVRFCNQLLDRLQISCNQVVVNLGDIAEIYRLIAGGFKAAGQPSLYLEAEQVAKTLKMAG